MAKVTFDGDNKIIQVNNGETELFFYVDVYIEWKNWLLSGNLNYEPAIEKVGGEILIPGQLTMPLAFILLNDWKIRPYEGQHILTIRSNVYSEDGTNPYILPAGHNVVVDIKEGTCDNDPCDPCSGAGTNGSGSGLTPGQEDTLNTISDRMEEVWRLMGLDSTAPVNITKTSRTTTDIDQSFTCDPNGDVTIERNP
jgi:hypothetical protein